MARLWRFCLCKVSLYLHLCVGFDEFMAFNKVTNCNHFQCNFQICVLVFLPLVASLKMIICTMCEVLSKHMC